MSRISVILDGLLFVLLRMKAKCAILIVKEFGDLASMSRAGQDDAADGGWSLVIKPRTSLFAVDFRELWRYRDLCGVISSRGTSRHSQKSCFQVSVAIM